MGDNVEMKKRHNTSSASVLNARYLRKKSTPTEIKLWSALRGRRLAGLKIRRQYPVEHWIIDFFCLEKMAGVEVDGSVHAIDSVKDHDNMREAMLSRMGIRILRVSAEQIENNLPMILIDIHAFFNLLSPSSGVSQERGLGGEEGERRQEIIGDK
jgi:very-short-patch-repair endonuclease